MAEEEGRVNDSPLSRHGSLSARLIGDGVTGPAFLCRGWHSQGLACCPAALLACPHQPQGHHWAGGATRSCPEGTGVAGVMGGGSGRRFGWAWPHQDGEGGTAQSTQHRSEQAGAPHTRLKTCAVPQR